MLNRTLAAGDYYYMVCQDHEYGPTYPSGIYAIVTIPMDGKYDITFTYNVGDDSPTATIKPSEGATFVIYSAQLLSPQGVTTNLTTRRNDNGMWTSALTLNEDGEYTITVTGSDNSSYQYKFTPEAGLPYQMYFDENTHDISVSVLNMTLTVVGDETLLGAGWNPANTECDMTSQDGKLYTLTLLNRTLAAENYNFKICKDHSWTTTYPAGDNAVVTIPADGNYNVTFCYRFGDSEPSAIVNPSNKKLTLVANSGSTDYYATFSDQQAAHEISAPTGKTLKIYDAKVANGKMTLTERSGNKVAKGEGVLIWSDSPTLSTTTISDELTATTTTDLVATPATEQTLVAADGYTLYRLTYNSVENKTGLGFYLSLVKDSNGNVDQSSVGTKLKATPGKAYLNVETPQAASGTAGAAVRAFVFPDNDENVTGIECITVTDEELHSNGNAEDIYDLQGRKVSKPAAKGVYIKNNKLFLN